LPFTTDLARVHTFLESLIASEGSRSRNVAQDLTGALIKVRELAWLPSTTIRSYGNQIIVITDAPCHGRQYYDSKAIIKDNFPAGHPSVSPEDLMIHFKKHRIHVTFVVTSPEATDQMIDRFNTAYNSISMPWSTSFRRLFINSSSFEPANTDVTEIIPPGEPHHHPYYGNWRF
jgi:hypothetical protein